MKKDYPVKVLDLAMPIGAIFIVIAIILLIWFFLHGQTTGNGEYPAPVTTSSIMCRGNNIDYPYFSEKNYERNELESDIVLGDSIIRSISIKYNFFYNSAEEISHADAVLRANMNISFAENGYGADALGAHYSKLNDSLKFSLMASNDEISSKALKYFLLEDLRDFSSSSITGVYNKLGLTCSTKSE